jgi:hypothetical protein
LRFVLLHDEFNIAQSRLYCADGIAYQAFAKCDQKQGLTIGRTLSVWVVHVVNEIFNIFAAIMPIAHFSVVHECPVFPSKRMAVASVNRSSGGCSYVGKKEFCLDMCR